MAGAVTRRLKRAASCVKTVVMTVCRLFMVLLLTVVAAPAPAQNRAAAERQFQTWLEGEIWPGARAKGVRRATFDGALRGVALDWSLPNLVPPGTSPRPRGPSQAEFAAPSKYFAAVAGTAAGGRQMAARHAAALAAAERRTGVPGRIILAIWGRESGYGRVAIPHNAFRVLATRGFMGERRDYFAAELVALLQIAEAGHAPSAAIRSSWAGALGQPQFMPSSFLRYAADGDGDGRADIWRSEADTIASIARYLERHGWVKGRDWGFEVEVPAAVSCALEGPDQGRRIADWEAMGIRRVSGRPFPEHERGREGFLMMPAGRHGPAFVVTPNFYVLKDYNFSDNYALFVGHVGDRIQYGMGDFSRPWGNVGRMTRAEIAAMQRALERMGHDVGGADGLPGFKTRRSIGRWQEARGQASTCFPVPAMAAALGR